MERIAELYGDLYQDMKQHFKEHSLSTLVPMMGLRYKSQTVKLMVIGRALNGWFKQDMDCTDQCSKYVKDAMEMLTREDRFAWMENKEENGNAIIRPFWNYTKDVLKQLRNCDDIEADWYETIAWANLFPISFNEAGNPSNALKYAQFPAAQKLLQEQIKYFSPTYVLIISGWKDWFAIQKSKKYHFNENVQFLPDVTEKCEDNEVVKGRGIFGNSLVVVSRRPEFFSKEKFVNDIVAEFKNL